LIIEEVLAVGDAEFQKKCMGKMEDVSTSGRTIIFVSHNFGAITQLCKKGVYLKDGEIKAIGDIYHAMDSYLSSQDTEDSNKYISVKSDGIFFKEIETINENNISASIFGFNESIILLFKIKVVTDLDRELKISITLLDKFQTRIFTTVRLISEFSNIIENIITIKVVLPKLIIAPNLYSFRFAIFNDAGKVYDLIENICRIKIIDTGTEMTKYEGVDYGSVILNCNWENA
jgi:lipopolysaccharide transport system ATP-binding protein